jgi:D-3-phosphoglycerate dehydrogenase / 2-oxoglutarate reductase
MKVLAYDPYIKELRMNTLEQMNHMKKGAVIINTDRGRIVNEDDLYKALVSGQISAAAMDVAEKEPMAPNHPLLSLEQVVVTPHIGMYSEEALNEASMICARNAAALLTNGELKFAVV